MKHFNILKYCLTLFLVSVGFLSIGKLFPQVVIDNEIRKEYSLKGKLYIYSDPSLKLNINDILKTDESHFDVLPDIWFETGYRPTSHWIYFELSNNLDKQVDLILNTWNSFFYEINFYVVEDSVFLTQRFFGSEYTFFNREFPYKNYAFGISAKPDKNYRYYIQIRNHGHPTYCRFSLESPQYFAFSNIKTSLVNGIYYGIIFFVFILNLMLFIFSREKLNFFYSLYALFLALYQATKEGYSFQYVWPEWPWFNLHIELVLISMALCFLLVFTRLFIQTARRGKIFDVFLQSLVYLFLTLAVLSFSDALFYYVRIITGLSILLAVIMCILSIVWIYKAKHRGLLYYSLFYLPVLLAITIHLGRNSTLLPINTFTLQVVKLSFIIQITLLAFELTNRFSRLLVQSNTIRANLETIVNTRVQQINSQNEELRTQSEELKVQKEKLVIQSQELIKKNEMLALMNTELKTLELVASRTNNLIYFFDSSGNLVWYNDAFAKLFGIPYSEYKNHVNKVHIDSLEFSPAIEKIRELIGVKSEPVTFEWVMKNKEGLNIHYQTTATPVYDENGNLSSLIAIDTDISSLKNYEYELNRQKSEYEIQRNIALMQKESLEFQQKELTDSLRYAKRIQSAILPNQRLISKFWPESFVLLMPRDIVSGDFYWYFRNENKHFILAVDCTGHGVPGAFMSIIGTYLLNTIIIQNNVSKPSEILKQLNRKIKISLNSENTLMQTNDGMDIAICVIDRETNMLEFGSAMRSLFLFNNNEFIELIGDKIPISSDISGNINPHYTDYSVLLEPGATFYMFSDGIIDQFGGKHNKKFLTKRFKQLVTDIQHMPMKDQKTIIQATIEDWKGGREQVDDIMVIGIKYL